MGRLKKGGKIGIRQERLYVQLMDLRFSQHRFSISARTFLVSYLMILPGMLYRRCDPSFDPSE